MERDSDRHTNRGWLRQIAGDLAVTLVLRVKIASGRLFKRRRSFGRRASGTSADGICLAGDSGGADGLGEDGRTPAQHDVLVDGSEGGGKVRDEVDEDALEIPEGYIVNLFGDVIPFMPEMDTDEDERVEVTSLDQITLFDGAGDTLDVDGRDYEGTTEISGDGDVSDEPRRLANLGGVGVGEDVGGVGGDDASATGDNFDVASDDMDSADQFNRDAADSRAAVSDTEEPQVVIHRGVTGQLVRDDDKPPQQPGRRVPTDEYYPRLETTKGRVKLRCQAIADSWSLYLDIPAGRKVSRVVQDGVELPVNSRVITLESFTGSVIVHYEDGDVEIISIFDVTEGSDGIVFKTGREWKGGWNLVRRAGNGYAIVFAWRDRDSDWGSGIVEHGREECVDERFQAYFLELTGAGSPNNTDRVIFSGQTIYDDGDVERYGELYVGEAPDLIVGSDVTVARVVRETGVMAINKRSFMQDFYPGTYSLASVLDGRDGWFGVRVYVDGDLGDNPPFRLCRRLARIVMDDEEYAGGASLYMRGEDVSLRFESQDGDALIPDESLVEFDSDGIASLGADMDSESMEFRFGNTPVFIEVPRLRWRLVDEEGNVGEWGNDILRFEADKFRELIESRIEISAPSFVSGIRVGFASDGASYANGGASGEWWTSLPNFADHRMVADMGSEDLSLMIFAEGQSATIARIVADTLNMDDAVGGIDGHMNVPDESTNTDGIQRADMRDIIRLHKFCQDQRAFKGVVDKGKGRPYYSRERRDYVIVRRKD